MSCEICKYSTRRPPTLTYLERYESELKEWEADTRKYNWFTWFYDPKNSKGSKPTHPYEDSLLSDYYEHVDSEIIKYNQELTFCDRFPAREVVNKSYKCGEFVLDKAKITT